MSLFPERPFLCELTLMCQMCQILSTMLKEAFVEVEKLAVGSSSLETVAGRVDGLSHSALCAPVSSPGSFVEAGQADPPQNPASCLPCIHVSLPLHPAVSTGENKLMEMKPYRAQFRHRL
ncbi:Hypothetical predicted protein [Xyrichtys novacula]|uniref:Uncharacterized protein n=1 Tax=Xyrichtys novacula TaxID=13765 RepID=A0AAV1HIB5_XYRNO|nr:Hypothetical predicted protein [Xyrichtys novacula]